MKLKTYLFKYLFIYLFIISRKRCKSSLHRNVTDLPVLYTFYEICETRTQMHKADCVLCVTDFFQITGAKL